MSSEQLAACPDDLVDRSALKAKLDTLVVAAAKEWGTGSVEHNLVRDVSDAVSRVPAALTAPTRDGEVRRLRALLQPFAEAAESLDDGHRDNGDIWESSAAIGITAGNLRAARAALATQAEGA